MVIVLDLAPANTNIKDGDRTIIYPIWQGIIKAGKTFMWKLFEGNFKKRGEMRTVIRCNSVVFVCVEPLVILCP